MLFSACFCKINEEDERSVVTEIFFNLNNNHILTEG